MSQNISLTVSDSSTMQAHIALPQGDGPFPSLLVFQEAFGVNRHIRDLTERFARAGYVAIAPELFHRSAPPGFEASYADFSAVAPHMQAVTPAGLEADIRACWDWIQRQPQASREAVACIGYCMGGRVAFMANALLPFK